uniref:Putative sugar transporter/spinster transmembrane protein n=1 Tax=Corethrella appendiculata TaxID=1370023 RepID=U5EK81_9DIPT
MPSTQKYQKVATDNQEAAANMDKTSSSSRGGVGNLPSTHSSQQLMPPDTESVSASINEQSEDSSDSTQNTQQNHPFNSLLNRLDRITNSSWLSRETFTVTVLCFVNLINYMDRFTIAGVLTDIQNDFHIGDDAGGLLQTVFVFSYMIFALLFGYLGDRYSRKWIMALGVFLWSATTLIGSYMTNFYWFITFRALVGIGEASYSTIAPTIISDLFISNVRSKMLALFYFAIPVGSGLGYIVGAETANYFNSWRYALRVTPILGLLAVWLILLLKDPERGQSEGSHSIHATSYWEDIKAICKNTSFMLSTIGFTCVAFVAGALAWWGPKFIHSGLQLQPGNENVQLTEVSFIFGALTMVSGIIGVPLGSYLSTRLNKRYRRADPIICAIGLICSAPLLAGAMLVVTFNTTLAYTLVFFGELFLNLNWAIVADILLYVIIPTRRSTAEAFQILISHAFGDAGSPYLVGVISESIKHSLRMASKGYTHFTSNLESLSLTIENATTTMPTTYLELKTEDTPENKFKALQYALFSMSFVEVLGGVFFLLTAAYILRDRENAERAAIESRTGDIHHFADNPTGPQID